MDIEEAKTKVGTGWHSLIDHYHDMVNRLTEPSTIVSVERRIGMLNIKASPLNDDHPTQEILDRLSWSVERDSAKVCEICGRKGFRRKILPEKPNLCGPHYVQIYSKVSDNGGLENVGHKIGEYILNSV